MSGHGLLKGKKGIIFGALNDSSIAWKIAEAVHREGGQFILSNAPVAQRLGGLDELATKTGASIVWADATSDEDLTNLFNEAKALYGGVDFVVHSIGMGLNVRKNRPYEDLNYEWYKKSLDISAISLHRALHAATETTGCLNDGGSVVALSYIGAQRTFSKYSENKGVVGEIYQNIVQNWKDEGIDIRGYESPISMRNIGNDVDDKTIESLLTICKKNSPVFQKFFIQKAKMLKMKMTNNVAHERSRIAGIKKVNEFKDGFLILRYILSAFLK